MVNPVNAEGVNYFKRCYVIMTSAPDTFTKLIQTICRSNREYFTGDQNGAIILSKETDKTTDFNILISLLKSKEVEQYEKLVEKLGVSK